MPRKILIVDDEDAILFAMREYFGVRGYEVDCAHDLDTAKTFLSRGQYSAVLVDLHLTPRERSDGLEIVEWVCTRCPGTRVIMLTAYGSYQVEQEARRLGVDMFLRKPTPLPEVARIVDDLVSSVERST